MLLGHLSQQHPTEEWPFLAQIHRIEDSGPVIVQAFEVVEAWCLDGAIKRRAAHGQHSRLLVQEALRRCLVRRTNERSTRRGATLAA
jgi:hypothetical protein